MAPHRSQDQTQAATEAMRCSMSTKRKNPHPPADSPQPAEPLPGPDNPPKQETIGENERPIENSPFSNRQQAAIPIIAFSQSNREASLNAGISESTLYRWLEDPSFRDELTRVRKEAANLAVQELRGVLLESVSVLAQALHSQNEVVRTRCARHLISFAIQLSEIEEIRADLREIETALPIWGLDNKPT